jgi:hypothetical protein
VTLARRHEFHGEKLVPLSRTRQPTGPVAGG